MRKRDATFMILLLPSLIGATYVEETHPLYLNSTECVTSSNCDSITNNYGYFEENSEFPTLIGDPNTWKMSLRFYRNTTAKIQIRLLYCYGQGIKFNSKQSGCNYYTVYESGFTSGKIGTYFNCTFSLSETLKDHGITTDYLNNIYTNYFYLGFYVDEHNGSAEGKFYYITLPTTYASGKHYVMNVGKYATNYNCYPDEDNNTKKEFHKRVFFGGKKWEKNIQCVGGGTFTDWRDFQNEERGEINSSYFSLPLKMELYGLTRADQPSLNVKNEDANLFIYEGYRYYHLGTTTKGYNGKIGYKIPIKLVYTGRYYVLKPRKTFYITPDYRNIYFEETIPNNGNNRDFVTQSSYIPIPAIIKAEPITFKFQIELLNAGPLGLVDIIASFSFTKSKNYFGSHTNSDYYVEEIY